MVQTTRDASRLLMVLSEEQLKAKLTSYRKVFPFFSELLTAEHREKWLVRRGRMSTHRKTLQVSRVKKRGIGFQHCLEFFCFSMCLSTMNVW